MKNFTSALILGLIILSVCIAGCSSSIPLPAATPENKLSTIEPSEMALQPSDISGNLTLKERSERVPSDVGPWAHDNGWKKGYYVIYQKVDLNSLSGTVIEQKISIYPIENISLVIPAQVKDMENLTMESGSRDELSIPNIGDSSRAYRFSNNIYNTKEYVIFFVKKDVYEELWMRGTVTDYETLKQLANVAVAKVK